MDIEGYMGIVRVYVAVWKRKIKHYKNSRWLWFVSAIFAVSLLYFAGVEENGIEEVEDGG